MSACQRSMYTTGRTPGHMISASGLPEGVATQAATAVGAATAAEAVEAAHSTAAEAVAGAVARDGAAEDAAVEDAVQASVCPYEASRSVAESVFLVA